MAKPKNTKTALGSLLSQARENIDTETQEPVNTETRENVNIETSESINAEIANSVNTEKPEKLVTMTISTPKRVKDYWIIQARIRGTTVSAMVKEFLENELGMPN